MSPSERSIGVDRPLRPPGGPGLLVVLQVPLGELPEGHRPPAAELRELPFVLDLPDQAPDRQARLLDLPPRTCPARPRRPMPAGAPVGAGAELHRAPLHPQAAAADAVAAPFDIQTSATRGRLSSAPAPTSPSAQTAAALSSLPDRRTPRSLAPRQPSHPPRAPPNCSAPCADWNRFSTRSSRQPKPISVVFHHA
jgi:hypothetical protein